MNIDWRKYPNFNVDELSCKSSKKFNMTEKFLAELQGLRTLLGRPILITSACRSHEHNKSVGGHPRSLHVCDYPFHENQEGALAVDVAIPNGVYRADLFVLAWRANWSIGWNAKKGFLHLDRRDFLGWDKTTFDY